MKNRTPLEELPLFEPIRPPRGVKHKLHQNYVKRQYRKRRGQA